MYLLLIDDEHSIITAVDSSTNKPTATAQ